MSDPEHEAWVEAARADHAERCERRGPPPQGPYENCPFRADHVEVGRRSVPDFVALVEYLEQVP